MASLVEVGRVSNSFALARSSWEVLKADRELFLLPVISVSSSLAVVAFFFSPVWRGRTFDEAVGRDGLIVMYLVLAYITVFFNAALISAANERLEGGDPTVLSAIGGAARCAGRVLHWALISAVVSIILRTIEERVPFLARLIVAAAGMAWSVITFLVLPVIVIEEEGPARALNRSGSLVSGTWGENLGGHIGLGVLGFLWSIPAYIFFIAGAFGWETDVGKVVVGMGALWALGVIVVFTALSAVYQTALYHYAVDGQIPSRDFDRNVMQSAFRPRRRFKWRR